MLNEVKKKNLQPKEKSEQQRAFEDFSRKHPQYLNEYNRVKYPIEDTLITIYDTALPEA